MKKRLLCYYIIFHVDKKVMLWKIIIIIILMLSGSSSQKLLTVQDTHKYMQILGLSGNATGLIRAWMLFPYLDYFH